MSTTTLFSALAAASIDKAAGTILGVSVISEGEAKGHSLFIDATTLAQVKAAAELFADGLQVKIDHWSGFDGIVGVLKNFTIDGQQLRADLSLLQTHDARERILEMSETMPGSFGLSIAFSGDPEEIEMATEAGPVTSRFARCLEIYSADLVDSPAANPTGLFSEQRALLTALNEELITLRAGQVELVALRVEVPALRADKLRLEGEQIILNELYTGLKQSLGLTPAAVVPAVDPGQPDQGSVLDRYLAMPFGKARAEFLAAHRDEIFAAQHPAAN
jgi:hypothetical protein